jgi:hypothetical protein
MDSMGLSFRHHEATLESPTLAEMERILQEFMYKHNFSPEMWQSSTTDFEIALFPAQTATIDCI